MADKLSPAEKAIKLGRSLKEYEKFEFEVLKTSASEGEEPEETSDKDGWYSICIGRQRIISNLYWETANRLCKDLNTAIKTVTQPKIDYLKVEIIEAVGKA